MLLIDFDRAFQRHIAQWVKDNAAKYGDNMDAMEQEMPSLYLQWIQSPADFLDGKSPLQYYASFEDAEQLVDWMCEYLQKRVPLPDLLLERIVELGDAAVAPLLALLSQEDRPAEITLHAMDLLRQLESPEPMALYLDWLRCAEAVDDRIELAADALLAMGVAAVPAMLAALESAGEAGADILLDILTHYPGDERVFDLALRRFSEQPNHRALFAGYLGKLGDERALPALEAAALAGDTNYLDYIEIANAIERLGGERPPERDFAGDPYYEALGKH